MRTLAALALLAALAAADTEISFAAGKNLTNADVDFKYRFAKTNRELPGAMAWTSASVNVETADAQAKANADIIFGVGTYGMLGTPPLAFAAYAKGEAEINLISFDKLKDLITSVMSGIGPGGDIQGLVQASAVGLAILSIEEVSDDGKVNVTYKLNEENWDLADESGEGELKYFKYSSDHCDLTFVTSNRAGVLNYGNAPVSPNTLEVILENKNFELKDSNNHFRVNVAMVSASGKASVEGNAQVRKVDGTSVYAAVSGKVVVDGQEAEAAVNIKAYSNPILEILTKFVIGAGGEADVQLASVDFPKGKSKFIYDPAVGAGKVVYGAAATSVISLLAALLCVVAALF